MNKEDENRLMGSLYRQTMYAKLMHIECESFLKYPVTSGIKNTLKRMKDCYSNGIQQVKLYMPKTNGEFQNQIDITDEKARAIANIIERIYVLDEETVLKLEEDFTKQINVQY